MDLSTFFEKFSLFADAPDAVAKMRELVLQLAVRGKLTEQDHKESSQSQLALAEVFRIRVGRRDQPDSEDIPFPIPRNWGWVAVGDTMNMINGRAFKADEWSTNGTRIIRIQNLNNETASFNHCKSEVDPKVHVRDGEFLISWSGTPGTSFGAFIWNRGFAYLNQHIFRCELVDGVFVKEFLRMTVNARLDEMISHAQGGVGLRHITKGKLEGIRLPLPPIAEQKRIVAKVDELMALCDRLEAQQQERETRHAALARASLSRFAEAPTPANLDFLFHKSYAIPPADLRKSILTLAVQGKLVPQDPNDEPAEELLRLITSQRVKLLGSASLRKTKPCREFTSDEAPYDVPETWGWTMLGEITDIGTGSTPSRTEPSFWRDGTIPWITSGSTSRSPINEGDEFVTTAAVKAHRLCVYPVGTLLVALYGQGKTRGQVASLNIAATINQACAAVCVLEGIPSMQGYLKLLLEKQYDEMRLLAAGGAQPNLNVQKIKELIVALPPLAEQRRIVAKVDQLMALVDQLETQLTASRATAARLLEALVAELTSARSSSHA
jgi:type I restriction enzyme S subunit